MNRLYAIATGLVFAVASVIPAQAASPKPVIEVVTLQIKSGVTLEQFAKVDHALETRLISKRAGFISRESAPGQNNSWLVIVHWRSLADAEASMNSFEKAPLAGEFMGMIEPNSMVMTRYGR